MTSEKRAQKFFTDDVSLPRSGKCFWLVGNLLQPIRSTSQIWVVTRHQNRISALVSQTSFRGESSGDVAKCRLFPKAKISWLSRFPISRTNPQLTFGFMKKHPLAMASSGAGPSYGKPIPTKTCEKRQEPLWDQNRIQETLFSEV